MLEIGTYSHSATSATHISLFINCLLQLADEASARLLYCLVRIRIPLPHVTEQGVQAENSVTPHSTDYR